MEGIPLFILFTGKQSSSIIQGGAGFCNHPQYLKKEDST
jgi:hypothetical protein